MTSISIRYFCKLFLFFWTALIAIDVSADPFPYPNYVWAYPDCNNPSAIRTWVVYPAGNTSLYFLQEDRLSQMDANEISVRANEFGLKYVQGMTEIYSLNGTTIKLLERFIDGKYTARNGTVISTGNQTLPLVMCNKNDTAAIKIFQKINQKKPSNEVTKPDLTEKDKIWIRSTFSKMEVETQNKSFQAACITGKQIFQFMSTKNIPQEQINSAAQSVEQICSTASAVSDYENSVRNLTKDANCSGYIQSRNKCATAANFDQCLKILFPNFNPLVHQYCN